MAISSVPKVKRDGTLIISGSGTDSVTVQYEAGDFNFSYTGYGVNLFLDRGVITDPPMIRKGDDGPMTLGFTAYVTQLSGSGVTSADTTLLDLVEGTGGASGWTSTMGTNSDVFTTSMIFQMEGSDFGGSDEQLLFKYCKLDVQMAEGDPNTYTISATSFSKAPVKTTL